MQIEENKDQHLEGSEGNAVESLAKHTVIQRSKTKPVSDNFISTMNRDSRQDASPGPLLPVTRIEHREESLNQEQPELGGGSI